MVGICLGVLVTLMWQQVGQTAPALTALDYVEIEQLYARYAAGIDAVPDDGDMWASVFTEDGVFETTQFNEGRDAVHLQGYEQLKAFAATDPSPDPTPRHYTMNILIEPTGEGARGSAYGLIVGDGEGDQRPTVLAKGVYHDQLVKTREGWRFKRRMGTWHRFGDELLDAWAQ